MFEFNAKMSAKEVALHFVSCVPVNEQLYELGGLRERLINVGT